jgi:hypothetical protein
VVTRIGRNMFEQIVMLLYCIVYCVFYYSCINQQMHAYEAVQLHVSVTSVTIFRVSCNINTRGTVETM